MQQVCGIYCIRNLINNKCYIGQSQDIMHRWNKEKSVLSGENVAWNAHLQNAWKKYGKENFTFSILEECQIEDLDDKEIFWIAHFDSFNNGYNNTIGGSGARGMVAWNKGAKLSDEYRLKLSEAHKNLQHTEDQKKKISEKLSGENNPHYGKVGFASSRGSVIYCITLKRFFGSAEDAARTLINEGVAKPNAHSILNCCKNIPKYKTAGKLSDNTKLMWRYATQEEINLLNSNEIKQ